MVGSESSINERKHGQEAFCDLYESKQIGHVSNFKSFLSEIMLAASGRSAVSMVLLFGLGRL